MEAPMHPRPRTLIQWSKYIRGLSGERLYAEVVAANSQTFTRALLDEGSTMPDVERVMGFFASRLQEEQMLIPEGGPWDLRALLAAPLSLDSGPDDGLVEVGDDLDEFEMVAELSGE
jgi:hypothetical protein